MRHLLFLCAALTLFAGIAHAEDLACLQRTRGRIIIWDKSWQADQSDEGVRYLVRDYREHVKKGEPKQYILTLAAQGPAQKAERTATIVKDLAAHFFCRRVEGGINGRDKGVLMALGGRDAARSATYEIPAFYPAFELTGKDLPFRRWMPGAGWVPAAVPAGERLHVCYTPKGAVGCVEEDFRLSKSGERKNPHVRLELPGPFLRRGPAGWAEDLPIGELEDAEIVSCPMLGRTFFCLATEKQQFGSELKALEQELKLRDERHPPKKLAAAPKPKSRKSK